MSSKVKCTSYRVHKSATLETSSKIKCNYLLCRVSFFLSLVTPDNGRAQIPTNTYFCSAATSLLTVYLLIAYFFVTELFLTSSKTPHTPTTTNTTVTTLFF